MAHILPRKAGAASQRAAILRRSAAIATAAIVSLVIPAYLSERAHAQTKPASTTSKAKASPRAIGNGDGSAKQAGTASAAKPPARHVPIDPSTMAGPGSSLTLNGATFQVGLQSSVSSLKSVASGLPGGVSASGGAIEVTEPGAVLDGYDFRGYSISVQADNVTIRNSLFDATGYHTVHQGAGSSRMVVEYNTFDGQKANIDTHSDMVLSEEDATIRNNEFVNLPSDAVNTAGGLIERNYFAGASYQAGAHADAISIHRTVAPLIIHENYIDYIDRADAAQGSNAAIKIVSHFGAIADVTVHANVLLGGGYTIYTGPDKHPVSNVSFTNNDVGLGQYGDLMGGSHGEKFTYAGNHRFSTDARLVGGVAAAAGPPTNPEK
jgi:hypothetical protein